MKKSHAFNEVSTTMKCPFCEKPIKKRFEGRRERPCFICFGILERNKGHVMQHIIPKGSQAPRAKFRIV